MNISPPRLRGNCSCQKPMTDDGSMKWCSKLTNHDIFWLIHSGWSGTMISIKYLRWSVIGQIWSVSIFEVHYIYLKTHWFSCTKTSSFWISKKPYAQDHWYVDMEFNTFACTPLYVTGWKLPFPLQHKKV